MIRLVVYTKPNCHAGEQRFPTVHATLPIRTASQVPTQEKHRKSLCPANRLFLLAYKTFHKS